jgi:YVTN family beta-propeller protein
VRLETAGQAATGGPARLYVGHTTPRLSVIDASSNLLLKHSEPLGQGRLTFVAPSLDQGRLFTAWSGSAEVLVVDAADLSVTKRVALEGGGITSLAVNPQNGRLWVATFAPEAPDSSVLHELDGASQQVLRRLSFAGQSSAGLRFRPDAALLYVRHRSASALSLVDPAAGAVRGTARLPQWPTDLALSADGRSLYVVNVGSERLVELDAFTGEPVRTLEVGTGAAGVLAHPDGQRLLVLNQLLGSVQVVELASGRVLDLIPVGRAPQALALAADGQGLYVANAGSGTVSLVDLEQRAVKETLDTGGTPAALVLLGPPRG